MKIITGAYNAIMRSPLLWGLAATAGFYSLLHAELISNAVGQRVGGFINRYATGHPVEYFEVAMFFVGMAALLLKRREVLDQLRGQSGGLLGPVPSGGQTVEDCPELLEQLDSLPTAQRRGYLARRLHEALAHVHRKGSAEALDDELKYLAETDEARAHRSYGLVSFVIWAIPILGFLGTVIGITLAIANLDTAALQTSSEAVVAALAVAFDTTALALALSIVLMFAKFRVNQGEQELLEQVDKRAREELAGRFNEATTGGDPQVAAVRRMSEAVIHACEGLVRRQAEVWGTVVQAAEERWAQSVAQAQDNVQAALEQATTQSLQAHAQHVAETAQTLAGQTHQQWAEMHEALQQNAETALAQQQALAKQSDVLRQVVEATGQVARLEDALNRNLAALGGAHNFAGTLESLAAVIHLLNARLTHAVPEAGRAA